MLLAREEHCYARHRRREFGMLVHWSEPDVALSRQQGGDRGTLGVRRAEVGSRYALNSRPHRQFLGLQSLRGHGARCGLGQSVPLVGRVLWNNDGSGQFPADDPKLGLALG